MRWKNRETLSLGDIARFRSFPSARSSHLHVVLTCTPLSSSSMHLLQTAARYGPLQPVKVAFDRVWDWSCYQASLGLSWLYVAFLSLLSLFLALIMRPYTLYPHLVARKESIEVLWLTIPFAHAFLHPFSQRQEAETTI